MTNYANWHAYYRTRMQLMKTAASQAFAKVDKPEDVAAGVSRFRVGYMSLNNNTGSDFLNLDEFKLAHKSAWYAELFAANPNSGTPLRVALSKAGRLYAGRLTSVNGVTATDPMQYSCQQNFTILSTDGFWNSGAGYKLDGSTLVGNQDGALPPPYNDGGATVQKEPAACRRRR
jgi:type IV pilus assembly protein PilY1